MQILRVTLKAKHLFNQTLVKLPEIAKGEVRSVLFFHLNFSVYICDTNIKKRLNLESCLRFAPHVVIDFRALLHAYVNLRQTAKYFSQTLKSKLTLY